MASVERCGPKEWRVRWREGGRGSKRLTSQRFATKAQADEYALQLAARMEARRLPEGISMTARDLAERWRLHLRDQGRVPRYAEQGPHRVILALGDKSLGTLDPKALRGLPVGARRLVRACLRWGVNELGVAVPPPCLRLPTGGAAKVVAPTLITEDALTEIQRISDAISPHLGAAVHLLSIYGHRPESIVKLRIDDLRGDRLRLRVKGGDQIEHPVLPETVTRLRVCIGKRGTSSPLILDHRTGKAWPEGQRLAMWYRRRIGLTMWPAEPGIYALKRRAITRMLGLGLDAATTASITGHRRPDILLARYARTNEHRQRAALAALGGSTAGPPA